MDELVDGPAAVLMVDVSRRLIVQVSDVARDLAPGLRLPASLDEWSDAADLRDPEGSELSDTDHPLSRMSRSEPVEGQVVTAARRSALGERRAPLWVAVLPMTGAPGLEGMSLVVLVPLRDAGGLMAASSGTQTADGSDATASAGGHGADPHGEAARPPGDERRQEGLAFPDGMHGRALDAAALSFTVADVTRPDQPLVWVNPAFTEVTGYRFEEAVGRNCRFLQAPDDGGDADRPGRDAASRMREAITAGRATSVVVRNVRKDGTEFFNQVDLSPVRDASGRVTHYVGIQTDVTDRLRGDERMARVLADEVAARSEAEEARRRLAFLVDALDQLTASFDEEQCVDRLLELVVPYLADWALVLRVPEPDKLAGAKAGQARRSVPLPAVAARHRDAARQGELEKLGHSLPNTLREGDLVDLLLQGGRVRRIPHLDRPSSLAERQQYMRGTELRDHTAGLDGREALIVAMTGRAEVRDVLVLVRTTEREGFTEEEVSTASELGNRAGLVLENATLFQAQRRIARVLQDALLSTPPTRFTLEGVRASGRYIPNETTADIGGDFYDALDHHDGSVTVVVGDVLGHDIFAAAAMGQLKGLMRAAARHPGTGPAEILRTVDETCSEMSDPLLATAAVLRARPTGTGWELRYANAGHPPLILRRPDGTAHFLTATSGPGHDALLGARLGHRNDYLASAPAGSVVIAYTDGLIERRTHDIDEGLDALLRAVEESPAPHDDTEALCDHITARLSETLGGRLEDDVALIAVLLPPHTSR